MRQFTDAFSPLKRLDFGGGDKVEYAFAAGFGLIILLALVLTLNHVVGGGGGPEVDTYDGDQMFHCFACEHEWEVSRDELTELYRQEGESPELLTIECPSCHAQPPSGVQMTICPECQKFYLPDWAESPADLMNPMAQGEYVCPHCGTNRREWYRKRFENR